jgi:hypothetical protein
MLAKTNGKAFKTSLNWLYDKIYMFRIQNCTTYDIGITSDIAGFLERFSFKYERKLILLMQFNFV